MRKYIVAATAAILSFSSFAAQAGGWGGTHTSAGGLINISPSVDVGDITALNKALNGNGILNGSAILNGNKLSGILNGNDTSVGSGILNNIGAGILTGGKGGKRSKRH